VLKNLFKHHNRFTFRSILQQTGIGCAILCLAVQNRRNISLIGIAFLKNNIQAFIGVKALFLGCIIACKLELVKPMKLKGDGF